MKRTVVVMAKRPAAGSTKTRLAPALSLEQAAAFYECLLIDTLTSIAARDDCTLVVAIDAAASADYFAGLVPGVAQVEQLGEELGDRLDAVMSQCLKEGSDHVFAIGSDSPDLPVGHLTESFDLLERDDVDVVLGPTDDGGYYLIGYKQRWRPLVTDVQMSTPSVLADTVAIAHELGARVALGPQWYDVDDPKDLDRLKLSLQGTSSRSAQFLGVASQ